MKRILFTITIMMLVGITSVFAGGTRYYVTEAGGGDLDGSSWENAFSSVKIAIETASEGDEIWVANGRYNEDGMTGNAVYDIDKDIKLYGGFEGDEASINDRDFSQGHKTILDAHLKWVSVIHTENLSGEAVIDGFTITNGHRSGNGGGIDNYSSSPTLANLTISGNLANSDYNGGGMYNYHSSPTLTNVIISGNRATAGGGGMYNANSYPTLINVTISDNIANVSGGGMYNANSSSPALTNVTISGNEANTYGGGVFNSSPSTPMLTNVVISGNKAERGGGMYNNASSSPALFNVTISSNLASANGGGIYNYSSSPALRNSIIWGNSSGVYDYISTITYSYCLVQDEDLTDSNGLDGTDASQDVFVAPEAPGLSTEGDYRLSADALAINAGNNFYSNSGTDLGGNKRIIEGRIDIGAHESTYRYNVSFDDGSSVAEEAVNHGGTVAEPNPAPTRNGYDFAHWYKDNSAVAWDFDTPITEEITLYANWTFVANISIVDVANHIYNGSVYKPEPEVTYSSFTHNTNNLSYIYKKDGVEEAEPTSVGTYEVIAAYYNGDFPGDGYIYSAAKEFMITPPGVVTFYKIELVETAGITLNQHWGIHTRIEGQALQLIVTIDDEYADHTVAVMVNGSELMPIHSNIYLLEADSDKEVIFVLTKKSENVTANEVLSATAISTSAGTITVEASDAVVQIVSINGDVVYNAGITGTKTVNVPAGIYLVVVNEQITKVLVK